MIKKESATILQQEKECETKIQSAKKRKQELEKDGMNTLNKMAILQNTTRMEMTRLRSILSTNKRKAEELKAEINRLEAQLADYKAHPTKKAQNKKERHTNTDRERGFSQDEITLRDAAGMIKNYHPVVHGHWRGDSNGDTVRCTACGYSTDFGRMSTFCPQCGAKMDEEV